MRISADIARAIFELYGERTQQNDKATHLSSSSTMKSEGVESLQLSPALLLIQKLHEQVGELTEVDTAKVDRVVQELARGTYRSDPEKVAEAILSELENHESGPVNLEGNDFDREVLG